ncbi:hypothetical protein IQ07DRAFT_588069 [Pyrenochaeta sp. DS3sAY3a]|nr:hypothetical protein IQ07DRAFT_588069 [Pyrenochaeta sp. DS3sAY3a]
MSSEQETGQSGSKQLKSYRFEDVFAYLDDDSTARSGSSTSIPEVASPDNDEYFMSDGEQEEPDDDLDEDEEEFEEADDDDDDDFEGEDSVREVRQPVMAAHEITVMEMDDPSPVPRRRPARTPRAKRPPKVSRSNIVAKESSIPPLITSESDKPRSRGIPEFSKIGGQETRLKDLYGPGGEDLKPILATRDYWSKQEALPSRQEGGLKRSFFERSDAREKETSSLQGWFADGGKEIFIREQKTKRLLSNNEHQPYLTNRGPKSVNILLGSVNERKLCTLLKDKYTNVAKYFTNQNDRRGWIFNLGARVQEAQWATKEESRTQYLAVAVEQHAPGHDPNSLRNPEAPAFTATKRFSASIQIWAFEAAENGELDMSQEPRLAMVICSDWGAPKQFRWCPIEAEGNTPADSEDIYIGLLAGIWSDGRARIVHITIPRTDERSKQTVYIHYSSAAFDVSFPQTIPTCLNWISSTTLAVATASGAVAMWTLTQPGTMKNRNSVARASPPWFYRQLADGYILNMASGWPSQPHWLSISVADGFSRLYDIRSPSADTVTSIRGRTLCLTQAWHENTQAFVMSDEHFTVKHNPIRRYHHNLYTMRSDCVVTRVAASLVHPGVLMGGTGGNVEASNPVGRIANYKVFPWQQKWFVHEWRGPVENLVVEPRRQADDIEMLEGTSPSPSNYVSQEILSKPLIRFTEGYKATQPGIAYSAISKKPTNPDVGKGITVFEEQTAITALAWNQNLKYGTWAVAGMGSGLLRVEDIGI